MESTRFPLIGRITLGFWLGVFIIVLMGVASFVSTSSLIETGRRVAHTKDVLIRTENLQSHIARAESAQRNFVLTGDERYLAPFDNTVAEIRSDLQTLGALTGDNPKQQERLRTLESFTTSRLESLQEKIDLRRTKGLEAAVDVTRMNRGAAMMENIRLLIGDMEEEESALLNRDTQSASSGARRTLVVTTIGRLLTLAFFICALLVVRREIQRNERLRQELQMCEERCRKPAGERSDTVLPCRDDRPDERGAGEARRRPGTRHRALRRAAARRGAGGRLPGW